MTKAIRVNGSEKKVRDALSSGPGLEPHTYELERGYVYKVGDQWKLQLPGQFPVSVTVSTRAEVR